MNILYIFVLLWGFSALSIHDEKQAEGEASSESLPELWPLIVKFVNTGKTNISISTGENIYTILPTEEKSIFISKTSEVALLTLNYQTRVLLRAKTQNIMDLLSPCIDLSPNEISLCTYKVSGKDGVAIAKKENINLWPFFASKQEFLENYAAFKTQRHIPNEDAPILDEIVSKLSIWKKAGHLITRPFLTKLDSFEMVAKDTLVFDFFSALTLRFKTKLEERGSLILSAEKGDIRGIERALQAGADINQKRSLSGKNVLHILAEFAHVEAASWVLSRFPHLINTVDCQGQNPLQIALKVKPSEMNQNPNQQSVLDQHEMVKVLFTASEKIRLADVKDDTKEANPLNFVKLGNNLTREGQKEDLTATYGPQNIFEDLGKEAIWSLSQALIKKEPWALNFKKALDFIALNRRLVAYLQEPLGLNLKSYFMGWNRFGEQGELTTPMSHLRQGSHVYAEKMYARLKSKSYYQSESFLVYEGPFENLASDRRVLNQYENEKLYKIFSGNVCHLGKKISSVGYVRLCCIDITNKTFAAVRHTRPNVLDETWLEMTLIFNQILYNPKAGLNAIAKLHWWLAQATPHIRGGGSIAEWMAIAVMLYKGIEFKGWAPGVETWSEAMIYSENEFIENYPQFLQ